MVVVGRTGSGKTTLARSLAPILGVPHVELDSLQFTSDLDTVPLEVVRERTATAVLAEAWVTDGNKRAVRDLVWPRAETMVWLDYPLAVSLWRLSGRARDRTRAVLARSSTESSTGSATGSATGSSAKSAPRVLASAARGVMTALRSHRGQRKEFPRLLARPEYAHLTVVRLRSPGETRRWLQAVSRDSGPVDR